MSCIQRKIMPNTEYKHNLEPVGGKFTLCCNFDLKKFPIKLPAFYEECLKSFAKCSATNHTSLQDQNRQDPSKAIVWNNKFICIIWWQLCVF